MKKLLKITGIVILILFVLILIIPFAFQGKIMKIAKEQIRTGMNWSTKHTPANWPAAGPAKLHRFSGPVFGAVKTARQSPAPPKGEAAKRRFPARQ